MLKEQIRVKDFKERYYFWIYNQDLGWYQTGSFEGYTTIEELQKENNYIIMNPTNQYKILQAKVTKERNQQSINQTKLEV